MMADLVALVDLVHGGIRGLGVGEVLGGRTQVGLNIGGGLEDGVVVDLLWRVALAAGGWWCQLAHQEFLGVEADGVLLALEEDPELVTVDVPLDGVELDTTGVVQGHPVGGVDEEPVLVPATVADVHLEEELGMGHEAHDHLEAEESPDVDLEVPGVIRGEKGHGDVAPLGLSRRTLHPVEEVDVVDDVLSSADEESEEVETLFLVVPEFHIREGHRDALT